MDGELWKSEEMRGSDEVGNLEGLSKFKLAPDGQRQVIPIHLQFTSKQQVPRLQVASD
jgi:hypothetical protein